MIKKVYIKIHTVFLFFMVLFWSNQILLAAESQPCPVGKVEDGISIFNHDKTGKRIWELHGSTANFLDDGYIEISNIKVLFYGTGKEGDIVTLQSPSAQVNQTEKKVRTDKHVEITSGDMVVTGNGLSGNMEQNTVKIKHNVVVILQGKNKDIFFPPVNTDSSKNNIESINSN